MEDDLFKNSTMSFGEHLEELRGALVRSLIGLLVGFLIALPLADDAVRFVSRPLEKALSSVYLKKAEQDLQSDTANQLAPEDWALFGRQQLVPSTMQLDADSLAEQLMERGLIPPIASDPVWQQLRAEEIPLPTAASLADKLVRGSKHLTRTPFKKVWNQLRPQERETVVRVASADTTSDEARDQLLGVLNRLIVELDLVQQPFASDLSELFPQAAQRRAVEQMHSESQHDATGGAARCRLNRLALAAALEEPLLAPRPRVIALRVWEPVEMGLQALSAQEPFLILIKAALILGLLISSPWVFYQIWQFVAAGLYPQERKYVYTYLPFSLGLFFAGAALAFLFVFEPVLNFLFSFNVLMNIEAAPRISEWVGFVLFLPIGFGISFQLPLVMLLLERLGILTITAYWEKWRIAVFLIFVASMFLTPADPMSMLLMAIPLTILYFGGIALCRYMPRFSSPVGVGYDPQ